MSNIYILKQYQRRFAKAERLFDIKMAKIKNNKNKTKKIKREVQL